jgi:methyl-accepting chemotaxis protein
MAFRRLDPATGSSVSPRRHGLSATIAAAKMRTLLYTIRTPPVGAPELPETPMFKSTKIRARLLLSFLGIASIGAVIGVTSMFYLGALSRETSKMMVETTAPLKQIFGVSQSLLNVRVFARDVALADRDSTLWPLSRIDVDAGYVTDASALLQKQVAVKELKDAIGAFMENWGKFMADLGPVLQRRETGADIRPELYALMDGQGLAIDEGMKAILDSYVALAAGYAAHSKSLALGSSVVMLVLLALGAGVSILLAFALSASFSKPVRLAVDAAAAIARGDLSVRFDERFARRRDELGELARALDAMTGDLAGGMRTIRSSIDDIGAMGGLLAESLEKSGSAVVQIALGIEAVSGQVLSQSAGVEETAATVRQMGATIEGLDRQIEVQSEGVASSSASVEEMVANIMSVASSIGRLGDSFSCLLGASEDGRAKLEQATSLIRDIAAQSDKLKEANNVVSGIAAKTNLLAMNAAIEAAHAGDAGRGFAVVADEIRGLAESAARQSKEITKDISGIRRSIDAAVGSAATAQAAFGAVLELIRGVSALEREITASLEEQREGSRQVLEALASINEVTMKVRSGSQELKQGSKAIGEEMGELQSATQVLRDAAEAIGANMRAIEAASSSVFALSANNKAAIDAVEGLLSRYVLGSRSSGEPLAESSFEA